MVRVTILTSIFVSSLLVVFALSSGCSIKLLSPEAVRDISKELGVENKEEKRGLFKELAREGGKGFGMSSPIESKEAGMGAMDAALEHREVLPIIVDEEDRSLWEWVGYERIREENYPEAEQLFRVIGEKKGLAKLVLIYLDNGNSFRADRLLRYLKELGYQFEIQKVYQEILDQGLYQFTLPFSVFFKRIR